MNELIINNRRLDLSEFTNIGVTFCANNIGELQNRQGNFTNTFKIPITKNNKEVLEYSHLQNSATLMPYKKLKATYVENGIEIISEGVAQIQSTDNNFFYLNVYSGNIDFIDAINDITVGELYLNDANFQWNISNVTNSSLSNYYSFPLIDWRKDIDTFFSTNTVDARQLLPCVNVKGMFDRLASYTGFNFSGNYLTSLDHLTMVLTPNEFSIPSSDAIKNGQTLISQPSPYIQIPTGASTSSVDYFPTFRNTNNNPDFTTGLFKPTINKLGKLNFTGEYKLFFGYSVSGVSNINKKQAYVNVSITDISGSTTIYGPIVYGPYDYGLNSITFDIETPEMTFLAGQTYKVKLTAYVAQTNKVQQLNLLDYDTTISGPLNTYPRFQEFTPSPKIAFNTILNFNKLFTMKVSDVLKDILNLRGIIIQTNNYTKTIQFNTFEDLSLNKSKAIDWSKKIQSDKSMSFRFGNYAKKNNFIFKLDTDKTFNSDTKNDSYFNLIDENLDEEKTVVKLAHPSTVLQNRYNGYIVPCINGLIDGNNEWNKSDWRLLNLKVQPTSFNVNYIDGSTTITKNSNINFCEMIGFETLVPKYYSTLQEILNNTKLLKIKVNLDITDITNLDFSIPIQIDRPDLNLSGYFYINKIENYKGNITSCEIIRL